ncbi:MAG: hypothetical protein ACRDP3_12760 [Streptomyces sp.]|uniref:hypothetical protein n=1 Tax=Streptomyces sp. TaxID=1931 RepID=UPI003D6AB613
MSPTFSQTELSNVKDNASVQTQRENQFVNKIGKKGAKAALVAAALGGTLMVSMMPASAAIDWDYGPYYTTDASPRSGKVYFEEYGDRVKICDTESDSNHVVVHVSVGQSTYNHVYSTMDGKNDGDCSYSYASDNSQAHNLPENRWIGIEICRESNSTYRETYCSSRYRIYNDR